MLNKKVKKKKIYISMSGIGYHTSLVLSRDMKPTAEAQMPQAGIKTLSSLPSSIRIDPYIKQQSVMTD